MAKDVKEAKEWATRLSKERASLAEGTALAKALRKVEGGRMLPEEQGGLCCRNSTSFQGGQSECGEGRKG